MLKRPQELAAAVEPLLKAREAVEKQIADLDRKVMQLARNDVQVRRFMTAPGIGPITALCYLAIIDDPTRFKRSRSVGAPVKSTGQDGFRNAVMQCCEAISTRRQAFY